MARAIKQSFAEIEDWYSKPDPWNYMHHPDDLVRKQEILAYLPENKIYRRALDIGAGEGWITQDLPAKSKIGFEVSENAASRMPSGVVPITRPEEINGLFDLVVLCGVLYDQYDWVLFREIVKKHAIGNVLTCNIKEWEHELPYKPIKEKYFPYREFTQHLALYDLSGS